MYKNRIRRTTPNNTLNSQPQFFIRRSDIAFDHRVKYVESVCATLVESRFGPGRVSPVIIDLSDRPELEPAVFYDLCEGEPDALVPCYALSPQGRAGYQTGEAAYRRAKQMGFLSTTANGSNSPAVLTPNQGRGSP